MTEKYMTHLNVCIVKTQVNLFGFQMLNIQQFLYTDDTTTTKKKETHHRIEWAGTRKIELVNGNNKTNNNTFLMYVIFNYSNKLKTE